MVGRRYKNKTAALHVDQSVVGLLMADDIRSRRHNLPTRFIVTQVVRPVAYSVPCSSVTRERANPTHITRGVTQRQLNVVLPNAVSSIGLECLSFSGADSWNMLPTSAQTCTSTHAFLSICTQFLGYPKRGQLSVGLPKYNRITT